jgi:hypothetical protein
MKRFFLGLVFTFLPLLGLAQTQPAASGVEGTITISPIRGGPVRQGAATSQPLADTAFEVKHDGQVVASFQTDAKGQFKVMLPSGHYTISRQQKAGAIGSYGPFEVDVSTGKMAAVQWDCDSGLR